MKTLNLIKPVALLLFVFVFFSCTKDEVLENKTQIKFEATHFGAKSTSLKSTLAQGTVIENFIINITEIEIEFDENDPMFATDSVVNEFELKGPFEIDLIKNGNTMETIIVNNLELPTAAYDEIEFEFSKSRNSGSEMFGKSVLIKGTINGTPFVFWTDEEFEVEIEFDEPVALDEASRSILTVSFNLASLFDASFGGVDISSAVDGNQNGIIEIYPGSTDGNNNLLDLIKERIYNIIEAYEEENDYYNNDIVLGPTVYGFTYNGITHPLRKGYFDYYGRVGSNPNSFKFDLILTDGGINYITEIGQGNIIDFDIWTNNSNEPAPGTYSFSRNGDPFTYTDGEIGFNANLQTDAGVFIDVERGDLVISKSGDKHTISADLVLENGKTLNINFTGVFTKM